MKKGIFHISVSVDVNGCCQSIKQILSKMHNSKYSVGPEIEIEIEMYTINNE